MRGLETDFVTVFGSRPWREKKPERKRKNLIRLGVPYGKAYAFSRTRKGGWAIAQSPILNTTITLERLRKRGYESMEMYYQKVSPMFNSLSRFLAGNRCIRDPYVQWCERRTPLVFCTSGAVYSIRHLLFVWYWYNTKLFYS
jgi:hypothetical protein